MVRGAPIKKIALKVLVVYALPLMKLSLSLSLSLSLRYPGQQGGTALADVLFGAYSPAGKVCTPE